MKLQAIRIFVSDMNAAWAFYTDHLQLRVKADGRPHGYVVFDVGQGVDCVVESVLADAPADDLALVGRFTGVSFAVDDIEKSYATLRARGVAFSGAPERQTWGGTLATLCDPCGNQLQLVQLPGA